MKLAATWLSRLLWVVTAIGSAASTRYVVGEVIEDPPDHLLVALVMIVMWVLWCSPWLITGMTAYQLGQWLRRQESSERQRSLPRVFE